MIIEKNWTLIKLTQYSWYWKTCNECCGIGGYNNNDNKYNNDSINDKYNNDNEIVIEITFTITIIMLIVIFMMMLTMIMIIITVQ